MEMEKDREVGVLDLVSLRVVERKVVVNEEGILEVENFVG